MKLKIDADILYNLELGEEDYIDDLLVLRVPGGWLFTILDVDKNRDAITTTFVPFNNEFQEKK